MTPNPEPAEMAEVNIHGAERCRFCGSLKAPCPQDGEELGMDNHDQWAVVCDIHDGGCGSSSGFQKTSADAVNAWNRRPSTDPAPTAAESGKTADELRTQFLQLKKDAKQAVNDMNAGRHPQSETGTPRCDPEVYTAIPHPETPGVLTFAREVVNATFARTLERELQESRREIEWLKADLMSLIGYCESADVLLYSGADIRNWIQGLTERIKQARSAMQAKGVA